MLLLTRTTTVTSFYSRLLSWTLLHFFVVVVDDGQAMGEAGQPCNCSGIIVARIAVSCIVVGLGKGSGTLVHAYNKYTIQKIMVYYM